MASPAFAATIKLGGDNGELGFFVSDPSRRSRFPRARVRPSAIAAASQSPMPLAQTPVCAVTRQLPDDARHLARVAIFCENRKQKLTSFTLVFFSRAAQQDHRRQG